MGKLSPVVNCTEVDLKVTVRSCTRSMQTQGELSMQPQDSTGAAEPSLGTSIWSGLLRFHQGAISISIPGAGPLLRALSPCLGTSPASVSQDSLDLPSKVSRAIALHRPGMTTATRKATRTVPPAQRAPRAPCGFLRVCLLRVSEWLADLRRPRESWQGAAPPSWHT